MEANHHPIPAGPAKPKTRRVALLILTGLGVTLAAFFAARPLAVWYWTPLTQRSSLKLFALDNDPRNFDVIILGASIAEFAFYPDIIEKELDARAVAAATGKTPPRQYKVYNAAIQGSFLPTHLEVMRNIVGKKQHPAAVMMTVSPRDLNGSSNLVRRQVRFFVRTPSDFWLVLTRADNPRHRWSAIQAMTHGLEVLFQAPLWPIYKKDVAYFQGTHGRILLDHYPILRVAMEADARHQISPKYMEELKQVGLREVRTQHLNNFVINDLIDAWIRGIIAEAKAKKVPLAIVMMPATRWFDEQAFAVEKPMAVEYLRRVCAETGTPFYNLEDPPFRPPDSDYFEGCDHLSYQGSIPLSRTVADLILMPLINGQIDQAGAATGSSAAPPAERLPDGKPVPGRTGFSPPAPAAGATTP